MSAISIWPTSHAEEGEPNLQALVCDAGLGDSEWLLLRHGLWYGGISASHDSSREVEEGKRNVDDIEMTLAVRGFEDFV